MLIWKKSPYRAYKIHAPTHKFCSRSPGSRVNILPESCLARWLESWHAGRWGKCKASWKLTRTRSSYPGEVTLFAQPPQQVGLLCTGMIQLVSNCWYRPIFFHVSWVRNVLERMAHTYIVWLIFQVGCYNLETLKLGLWRCEHIFINQFSIFFCGKKMLDLYMSEISESASGRSILMINYSARRRKKVILNQQNCFVGDPWKFG